MNNWIVFVVGGLAVYWLVGKGQRRDSGLISHIQQLEARIV